MPPRVWLVLGDKQGDNSQAEALAAALPWSCERRRIALQPQWVLGKPKVEPSLHHLDLERSDPLEPPWPDLILTIGRRPCMVALWIREQSAGRSRVVLLGKPSGMMQSFDLVIGSAEVQLPPLSNVFKIGLPLMRVDPDAVARAAEAWRERFAELPRPLHAFLVGGPTGPFRFDARVLERLLSLARRVAAEGGTPYVTTSRRTPPQVVDSLIERLPSGARLFRWSAQASENPYAGLLGLADGFVVTGDSISMLVEVARLGRPLAILPLSAGPLGRLDQIRRELARWLFAPEGERSRDHLRRRAARALFHMGLVGHTRDFGAVHRWLVARGLAVWAGEPLAPPRGEIPDDRGRAAARVRALMEGPGAPARAPAGSDA